MELAGDQVVLRPARREDAEVIAQGFVDDPTMGAMLGMDPEEETAEFLAGTFPENGDADEESDSRWFVITPAETGETVGEIGLVDISWPNRRAGISILVLPGSRRSGLGRAAIELLVTWAHGDLGLHRIEIHTLPENGPMNALAIAAGFEREGVLRDYSVERGRLVDNVVYSKLP